MRMLSTRFKVPCNAGTGHIVVTTLRQQDRDVLGYLTEACQAARQGEAAPSLLPTTTDLEDQLPVAA